jgi:methylmalonyl-CoA/ethylmalonyl-CoA epimerase
MLLGNRIVHHLAYVVDDIEKAVQHWSFALGAGPFYVIERMVFDEMSHRGKPCVFDHSAAFGQWGPMVIELQQIFASGPQSLTDCLIPARPPAINHVAYLSPVPAQDSAELTAAGHELFLHAKFGPVEIWMHDTRAILGQSIEVHRQCAFLDDFFGQIAGAAKGWDGKNPLRLWKVT